MVRSLSILSGERPVLFDGAMGTELYRRNQFVNVCFEELSVSNPGLVRSIHEAYLEAGADVITTNSFGANRFKLGDFLLADRSAEIAGAAARLARAAAGETALVAGSVGPLGRHAAALEDEEAIEAFVEVIDALLNEGADFLLLETFGRRRELASAVRAARLVSAPYIPCLAFGDAGLSVGGERIRDYFDVNRFPGGEGDPLMLGFNCSIGPKEMLENIEDFVPSSPFPVLVMPNAGFPQRVNDRMIYMTSPEYFASYAKRFVELGVRGLGGCCGTGPEHIAEAARSIKALRRVRLVTPTPAAAGGTEPEPLGSRTSFGAKLVEGRLVATVEIVPPLGWDLSKTLDRARRCAEAGVDAINVPDGPRASARVSPLVAAHLIQERSGIEAVLHVTCRDRNIIGVQSDLLGCAAAGVNNILVITGDPPKLGDYPYATAVFDVDSIGLAGIVAGLNRGLDVGGKAVKPPTRFVVGVGVDPSSLDQGREIDRFFRKAEAGAEYAITQPVYDVEVLIRFLEAVRPAGIPILAGVWPLASYQNAMFLHNEVPGVRIPEVVLERMRAAMTKEEARVVGIDIAIDIATAVLPHVRGIQVSAPFGNVETAISVIEAAKGGRGG